MKHVKRILVSLLFALLAGLMFGLIAALTFKHYDYSNDYYWQLIFCAFCYSAAGFFSGFYRRCY